MTLSNTPFTQSPWSLADLFAAFDSPELKAAFVEVEQKVAEFETKRPLLSAEIASETFLGLVRQLEQITHIAHRINGFAGLWFSSDTQNQDAQNLVARVDQFMAVMQNRTLFFSLWWKELDDANAKRLMAVAGDYGYWLEEMRHFKPHTLSEPEEKIINIKNTTGANAMQTLYDTITNRYVFKMEVEGQTKEMTRGELMVYARHHDPDLREKAYRELYRVYGGEGNILGQMYQALVRDWKNEQVEMRHFTSPIAARNLMIRYTR